MGGRKADHPVPDVQVEEAREALKALRHRVHTFMAKFDLFCSPCVMMPPFDVTIRCALSSGMQMV